MTGHIYIYGEIENWQSKEAEQFGLVSLKSVTEAINQQSKADELHVHIHSIGGDVVEGLAIYDALKATGKKIITINEGACYSIASTIYLAGEKRLTMPHAEFVIHNAWGRVFGDADDMKKYADELDKAVNKIVNIYKDNFNIDEERIRSIMKEDRIMEVSEAVEIGLATEISEPLKAVAKFVPNTNNNKNKKMSKKQKNLFAKFNAWLKENETIKNLVVKTADQTEVDFTELEDDTTPKVGDTATVDGEKADGSYVLQDDTTYVFIDGELTEIKEPESTEEVEALQTKIDELEAEKTALQNKYDDKKAKLSEKKTELKNVSNKLESLKALVSENVIDDKGKQSKKKPKVASAMGSYITNLKNKK